MYLIEDEEAMLEEEDLSIQRALFLSGNTKLLRSRGIDRARDLRNCSRHVIQKPPAPALDNDDVKMKMKGVDNSCTLGHMFSYNLSRERERQRKRPPQCYLRHMHGCQIHLRYLTKPQLHSPLLQGLH